MGTLGKRIKVKGIIKEYEVAELLTLFDKMLGSIVQKYSSNPSYDYQETFQLARIGLWKSYERYDIERGLEFSSYCYHIVYGEVRRYYRDLMLKKNVHYTLALSLDVKVRGTDNVLLKERIIVRDMAQTVVNQLTARQTLARLRTMDRLIVDMRLDGYTIKEIGQATKRSNRAVYDSLGRVRTEFNNYYF